jgi:hypothetical protein
MGRKKKRRDRPASRPGGRGASPASGEAAGAAARRRRWFWPAAAAVMALFAVQTCWDIDRPFYGLHAWNEAAAAWRARALLNYPLSYTRGAAVWAVGDPPPEGANRSFNHPQLGHLLRAATMAVTGQSEWSYRIWEVIWSLAGLAVMLALLRALLDEWAALLTGLVFVLLPVNAYFMPGLGFALQMVELWCYLAAIGALRRGPPPRARHLWGLAAASFVAIQLGWAGFFMPVSIGLHYAGRCVLRRQWPAWKLLAAIAAPPLASLAVVFLVMLAGLGWDPRKIIDLYTWRGAKGEMPEFLWSKWFDKLWEFALLDFTWPVLLAGAAFVVVHLGELAAWAPTAGGRKGPRGPTFRPYLILWFLPGLLQLLLLRGALWAHQYWLKPLGPAVALSAGLAVYGLWKLLRRLFGTALVAHAAAGALIALFAVSCARGTAYFYGIRWHREAKIDLFKWLHREIPPHKALLSLESFKVNQHEVKGAHYRPEIAWYLDRPIVQEPNQDQFYEVLNQVGRVLLAAERARQNALPQGRIDPAGYKSFVERLAEQREDRVRRILQREVPRLVDQIQRKARTERFSCYLMPADYFPVKTPSLASEAWGRVLEALSRALARRYPEVHSVEGFPAVRDDEERRYKAPMFPYVVYDLTKPKQAAPSTGPGGAGASAPAGP